MAAMLAHISLVAKNILPWIEQENIIRSGYQQSEKENTMTKNVRHQAAASYGREAKGSYADMQMKAYTQQCRQGKRQPIFTPRTFGRTGKR
jgi:hypothetical protein